MTLLKRSLLVYLLVVFVSLNANEIIIGSGEKGKGYYSLASSIQKVLKKYKFKKQVKIIPSSGSTENLIKLNNGEIDLAITQNDVAFFAENAISSFEDNPIEDLFSVISFYQEPIFILTNQKNINNIEQLVNHKINIGQLQSGIRDTAIVLFKAIELWNNFVPYRKGIDESIEMLISGKLQAILLNHIDDNIKKQIRDNKLFLVPISDRLDTKLHNTYPYFVKFNYETENDEKVSTISVMSMLVANSSIDERDLSDMLTILHDHYDELVFPSTTHKSTNHFRGNSLHNWHPATISLLVSRGIPYDTGDRFNIYFLYMLLALFLLAILAVLMGVFILHHADLFHRFNGSYTIVNKLKRVYLFAIGHKYILLLSVLVTVYVSSILLIKYFEHQWAITHYALSDFDNLSLTECFSWLFVFGSSGYNDNIFPSSEGARLVTSLVPLFGVGGVIALIGLVTFDQFKKYFMEVNGLAVNRIKDHIILCGWNDKAHFIVENLLHKNLSKKKQIVILAEDKYENVLKKYEFDPMHVFYIKGRAVDRDDLRRANVSEADIAIVISDNQLEDPDARTILKVLTIEKFSLELEESGERKGRSNIHTIAEIADPQNIQIAEDAGVDQIISLGSIESKIFTQAVLNPGVAKFMNEIMTYNDQNDIYSFAVTSDSLLFDKTYDEILLILRRYNILLLSINVENRKIKKEVDLIIEEYGLGGPIITNPFKPNEIAYKTRIDDLVIVLAQYEKSLLKALADLDTK